MSSDKRHTEKGFAQPKAHWRTLLQFTEEEVGAAIDALARSESRQRAGMAKRLVLEALATRGLWDLDNHAPPPAAPRARPDSRSPDRAPSRPRFPG